MHGKYWALLYVLVATLMEWHQRNLSRRIEFDQNQLQNVHPVPLHEVPRGGFVIVPNPGQFTTYPLMLCCTMLLVIALLFGSDNSDLIPLAFLLAASLFDFIFSQIPNSITFGMAAWGLTLRCLSSSGGYWQNSADGMMYSLLIVLIAVPALRMGGGDIKLMMGCGIWLGWPRAGVAAYLSFVGLTAVALVSLIWQYGFKGLLERCKEELWALLHRTTIKPAYVGIGAPIITVAYQITLLLW